MDNLFGLESDQNLTRRDRILTKQEQGTSQCLAIDDVRLWDIAQSARQSLHCITCQLKSVTLTPDGNDVFRVIGVRFDFLSQAAHG